MSLTVSPTDALADGCPVLTKLRAVTAQKGTNPTMLWPMRDANGNPLDLSELLCTPSEESQESETGGDFCGQIIFRFGDAVTPCELQQVIGKLVTENPGEVSVELPDAVTDESGLWRFQVAITDAAGKIQFMNEGLLSVERGFFGDTTKLVGPPTLNDLRLEIRDLGLANVRLEDFEFSDSEVVHALVKPLQQWNERPPAIGKWTSRNFPYPYNWLRAAVAELLVTAAHYYRRNKTKMQAAGVIDQSLDRDQDYEMKAAQLRQEWLEFVDHEKVRLNADMGFTTMDSGWY